MIRTCYRFFQFGCHINKKSLNSSAISVGSSLRVSPVFIDPIEDCLACSRPYLLQQLINTNWIAFIVVDKCLILNFFTILNELDNFIPPDIIFIMVSKRFMPISAFHCIYNVVFLMTTTVVNFCFELDVVSVAHVYPLPVKRDLTRLLICHQYHQTVLWYHMEQTEGLQQVLLHQNS